MTERDVVEEDSGVVDGWVKSGLGKSLSGESWDIARGGEDVCDGFVAEAGKGVYLCGVAAAEGLMKLL